MIRGLIIGLLCVQACAMLGACAGQAGARGDGEPLVLVAGATGGTGQAVVEQALERGYRVRVLVRDADKARTLFGDRVAYAVGDVREPRTLRAPMRSVRYVVCALGSSNARDPQNGPQRVDYEGVKALAEAARAAGVQHFVLTSAMGVTNPDHQVNRIFDNLLQWKLRGENALRETGLNYTIVRPGRLTIEEGGRQGIKVMQGDPQDVSGRIPRDDVAAVLVNALGRPDAYGKTFEIVSEGDPAVDWTTFFAKLKPDAG